MLRWLRRNLAQRIDRAVAVWDRRHSYLRIPVSIFHGAVAYEEDGLVASQIPTFMDEERFRRALRSAEAAGIMTGPWRIYICCWLADMVRNLKGDFVECGVNMGGYSRAVIDYIDFSQLDKTFYLLAHAVAYAMKLAATMASDRHLLVNLSGRGDKDIGTIADLSGAEFYCRPSCKGQAVKR